MLFIDFSSAYTGNSSKLTGYLLILAASMHVCFSICKRSTIGSTVLNLGRCYNMLFDLTLLFKFPNFVCDSLSRSQEPLWIALAYFGGCDVVPVEEPSAWRCFVWPWLSYTPFVLRTAYLSQMPFSGWRQEPELNRGHILLWRYSAEITFLTRYSEISCPWRRQN